MFNIKSHHFKVKMYGNLERLNFEYFDNTPITQIVQTMVSKHLLR